MTSITRDTASEESVEIRVLGILREGLEVEVASDMDVIRQGLLDSLNFVDLILRLEEVFEVQIDVEDVELDDFRTAQNIAAYLTRHHQIA